MTYYADTAYDSTKTYDLSPIAKLKLKHGSRTMRRTPLDSPSGVNCGEYLAQSNIDNELDFLTSDDPRWQKERDQKGHEIWPWETFSNPKSVVAVFTWLMGFLTIIGFGALLLMILTNGVKVGIETSIVTFLPFLSLYLLGKITLRFNLITDKGDIIFNRRTGLVKAYKKGKRVDIPFAEFEPFYPTGAPNPTGSVDFHLYLGHYASDVGMQDPEDYEEAWGPNLAWEFLQQFMDISKPLPELPMFEPYRSKDPTTAEYDRKMNRPQDYWQMMDRTTAYKLQDEAIKAAKDFPWGQTRKDAKAMGWQKSKYGAGDYKQELKRRQKAELE